MRCGNWSAAATSWAQWVIPNFIESLDLDGAARSMQASLLCLQGGLDPLVDNAEARQGPEARYWPEGIHCLYNHAIEGNSVLAEWFASKLM